MEKAVLKTLIYADLFDYPLKAYEIHKWLIGKTATLKQVEKALIKLRQKGKINSKYDHFFLLGRQRLIKIREIREKQANKYFLKAKLCGLFLKLIPSLKLVGISGGLALKNAEKKDDIDLFLITEKNRIWQTRFLVILILDLLGVRRKARMKAHQTAGKICINILLEEDKLEQENKDLFVSHEVLQMKVLWQRDNTYKKYLEQNSWVFEFLPNWVGPTESGDRLQKVSRGKFLTRVDGIMTIIESWVKWFQLKIMQKPLGHERIEEGALYFHPNDVRREVLTEYKQRLKSFSNT